MCGEFDSLKDDIIRLAYRIQQHTDTCSYVEIEGLKHGFLGYQQPLGFGVDEVDAIHDIISEYIAAIVGLQADGRSNKSIINLPK